MIRRASFALALVIMLVGCAQNPVDPDTKAHIAAHAPSAVSSAPIPNPVALNLALPRPRPAPKTETYSVVVHNVRAQDLLFALARDARINVDIHPGITGTVTLNALDQTLPQLLDRVAQQVDMRYEMHGDTLIVMPDSPFLRTYKIDYVNLTRDTTGTVSIRTEIAAAGGSATQNASGGAGNNSQTQIENKSRNHFWDTLIQNVKDLLRETDKIMPETASLAVLDTPSAAASDPAPGDAKAATARKEPRVTYREAAAVIANPETGVISIRATSRQHEKIQEFLDRVQENARREVLIEATIAEVSLSDRYQQGIDWSKLSATGFSFVAQPSGAIGAPESKLGTLSFKAQGGGLNGSVSLLDTFGTVKILSSPKLSVLNNQTAVLKVVDNTVYFTISAQISQNQFQTRTVYTTEVHSVPIGLVLNVTAQIGDNDTVLLNLRPSISRIVDKLDDPNPDLKSLGISNKIPVVRSREIDSVIRVENGSIAIMGGLMEDAIESNKDTIPVASRLPLLGSLFQNRDDTRRKSELVILLKPTIVRRASLQGDFHALEGALPRADTFEHEAGPSLLNLERREDASPHP